MITIILGLSLKISPAQNITSSFEMREFIKIVRLMKHISMKQTTEAFLLFWSKSCR